MKNMKRLLALVMAVLMTAVLTACGSGDSGTGGSADQDSADAFQTSSGSALIVGTEPTFPPFDTTDDEGNIIGFDMDLIEAIGEDQGFQVEFKNLEFDGLIGALQSGTIDIAVAGMEASDDRKDQVDFSDPYYEASLVVAVAADNTTIQSVDDLAPDMKVAAQIGTTGADYINELAEQGRIKEAVVLSGLGSAMRQLIDGDVQAVINDTSVTQSYISKWPDKIKMAGGTIQAKAPYSIAVQKGNKELLEKINTGLANIKDDGTFDQLLEKWFSEPAGDESAAEVG